MRYKTLQCFESILFLEDKVKKSSFLILLGFALILVVSCFTTGTTQQSKQSTAQQNRNSKILSPNDIIGKKLTGVNVNGGKSGGGNIDDVYQLQLYEDGTFEYIKNGNAYKGKWTFDIARELYRYVFEWEENGNKQGYIMDFMQYGDDIIWMGQWFITDAYKQISVRFKVEDGQEMFVDVTD